MRRIRRRLATQAEPGGQRERKTWFDERETSARQIHDKAGQVGMLVFCNDEEN